MEAAQMKTEGHIGQRAQAWRRQWKERKKERKGEEGQEGRSRARSLQDGYCEDIAMLDLAGFSLDAGLVGELSA